MDLDAATFDDVDPIFDASIKDLNLSVISDRLDNFGCADKDGWLLT